MSLSSQTWKTLQASASSQLLSAMPGLNHDHSRFFKAMRDMLAFGQADLTIEPAPGQVSARLVVAPRLTPARSLRAMIDGLLTDLALTYRQQRSGPSQFDVGRWVDQQGFPAVVIALVKKGVPHRHIVALAELLSVGLCHFTSETRRLSEAHFQALFTRDHPELAIPQRQSATCMWLLACEYSGRTERQMVLTYRRQALSLYYAISRVIMEHDITAVIDAGAPLQQALQTRLSLTPAELRRLQNARFFDPSLYSDDFTQTVVLLKDHDIAVAQWPLPMAWEKSTWYRFEGTHLLPAGYLNRFALVNDAVKNLRDDLIIPLAHQRVQTLNLQPNYPVRSFLGNLSFPKSLKPEPARRDCLAGLRRAILGRRGPKVFEEAAQIWHRKAATIAAFRHERTTNRPGWPALCAPWCSAAGRYSIVPLTSAADLVIEGRIMDHCVGSYYQECRSGLEQILSVRRDGRQVATLELLLSYGNETLSIKVGQFQGRHNQPPTSDLFAVLRDFMCDLNEGRHPVDTAPLFAHRKAMHKTGDYGWDKGVDVDFSRDVFALYRPLLPRDAGETFDAWCENTGLIATLDAALRHLAGQTGGLFQL